jgi:hypothetical protein
MLNFVTHFQDTPAKIERKFQTINEQNDEALDSDPASLSKVQNSARITSRMISEPVADAGSGRKRSATESSSVVSGNKQHTKLTRSYVPKTQFLLPLSSRMAGSAQRRLGVVDAATAMRNEEYVTFQLDPCTLASPVCLCRR